MCVDGIVEIILITGVGNGSGNERNFGTVNSWGKRKLSVTRKFFRLEERQFYSFIFGCIDVSLQKVQETVFFFNYWI